MGWAAKLRRRRASAVQAAMLASPRRACRWYHAHCQTSSGRQPCVRVPLLYLAESHLPCVVALLVECRDAKLEALVKLERDDDLWDTNLVGGDAAQPAGTREGLDVRDRR